MNAIEVKKLSTAFQCECNGKIYDSPAKLKQHQKTNSHIAWVNVRELRELKITLTQRDNEIMKLKNEKEYLREWCERLLRS